MEVFYTSLNAKELFSIPSTIRMTIHKCFNQEIQFYNWVYIYIFYIYLSIIFFFWSAWYKFYRFRRERNTYTFFIAAVYMYFLINVPFKIRIFSEHSTETQIELELFAHVYRQ